MRVLGLITATAVLVLVAGCGGDAAGGSDGALDSGSTDLRGGDFANAIDLAGPGDLASGDLACSAGPSCMGACCGGQSCTAAQVCAASCGAAQAACNSSSNCCFGLYCDPASNHCVACAGAGRVPGGQSCPSGNSDCCSGACVGGTCEF